MLRMTATEAAREFSEVLSLAAGGEEIEITRNGTPLAVLAPLRSRLVSAARFRALMAAAPPVDDGFADDVRATRESVGPPEGAWQS